MISLSWECPPRIKEFTRPIAQAAIDAPDLEPEDKKAPWPLRYTLYNCPRVYLLFFALRARVAFVDALKGFAFLLGAAFLLDIFI